MDVSPEVVGDDESFSAEEEDEDLCRICRSPEEPGNPLRYPCSCRGSIKYVHEDCLRIWLDRRGYRNCEVCGRSYSFVPVYSENAPERLSFNEFLLGVLSRIGSYMRLIVPWIVVILFNAFCNSLHPLGQKVVSDFQRVLISRKLAFLCASAFHLCIIVCFMQIISLIWIVGGDLCFMRLLGGFPADNFFVILCDWYCHKLIDFVGPPRQLILVPPNPPLHEFGVIRTLLFFFNYDAFAVLAISVYLSTPFVLLPFSIGWVVLATVGGSYLSGNSPVFLGYMMTLSFSSAYFGILFILHQSSFLVIVRWLSLGFHFITVTLPCHLLAFLVKACRNLFFIKDAFVLFFKIGALPWIVGWFLGVCISPMFGTMIFQRLEIPSHMPYMMMVIHWLIGFFCLINAIVYMTYIQEIIHKRALGYLLDVTDPDYRITNLNLRHMFFVFASHGILLVILYRLPIKAITLVSPSFFPLELWLTDVNPFIGVVFAIYCKLLHDGGNWLIGLTKPAIELIIHYWIIIVSSWLQLSDFLLAMPRGEDFQDDNPWFLLYSLAEGSMVTFYKSQDAQHDMKEQRDNRYRTRLAIMLMLAALSLFLVSTAFMALPILVGRLFFYSISFILLRFGIKHDDFCAFWIGCYILRAIYISICFAFDHIWTGRTGFLLKYILIRIRSAILFSIWIFIIPGLLGLLIDLMIIIPLRVPLNESPIYFLIQDWLIGVVVLHIWTYLTMLTPIKCFATNAWRRKLERIRNVGINSLSSMWLLRDVIGSIINTLLTTFSIPYVLVKSLLPLLGFSQSVNATIARFIWPALLALIVIWFVTKLTLELIIYLHQLIFNERYLVGERVGDLTEDL